MAALLGCLNGDIAGAVDGRKIFHGTVGTPVCVIDLMQLRSTDVQPLFTLGRLKQNRTPECGTMVFGRVDIPSDCSIIRLDEFGSWDASVEQQEV
jgi:hypothetical protein